MAHVLEIGDAAYQMLADAAQKSGTTPEQLLEEWLEDVQQRPISREETAGAGSKSSDLARDLQDPWHGFIGAAEATSPNDVERHDHVLAEAHAGTAARNDNGVR